MNKKELLENLKNASILERFYKLEPPYPNHECLCLEYKSNKWTVYFLERGKIWDFIEFETEPEACEYFFKEALSSKNNKKTSQINQLEESINQQNSNGSPPNTFQTGFKIDRYGLDLGRFASPLGTPFDMRSLPNECINLPYQAYEIVKPVEVVSGIVAPAFGNRGGGIQYILPKSIKHLIELGFLKVSSP